MQDVGTRKPPGFVAGLRFGLGVVTALALSMTLSAAVLGLCAWLAWGHLKASVVSMATDVVERVDARRIIADTASATAAAARDRAVSATGAAVDGARHAVGAGTAVVGSGASRLRDAVRDRFVARPEQQPAAPAIDPPASSPAQAAPAGNP